MNFPETVERVADMPDDFEPIPLGNRADLIAQIREVAPNANFSNPEWGVFEGDGYSIELLMGSEEVCKSIWLMARGGGNPTPFVGALLDRLKLRAIDCQTSEFFDLEAARASFGAWQRYRDQIIGSKTEGG